MQIDYPYHFDGRDRTAITGEADHIRDMIEQIIFTTPGERVNRPDFGAGVLQLLFGPASPEAAATAEFLIKGALQQHLGRRIELGEVATEAEDSTLRITIRYRLLSTGEERTETFERGGGP
jgi:phage baseplate assembly protein W